jgi:4'-phosphopantetheinyl transferase EntD
VLERILPPGVAVVATGEDVLDAGLFAEEEEIVGRAVEKRRREFATGRACARAALERLGAPPGAIPAGPRGDPRWPEGVVGSITHCDGYRAAAVAWSVEVITLGVDAEPDAPLPEGVLGDIALPGERARLADLARRDPGVSWDRLLFSIKESVYKAWFPLAERWLGFEDASVTLDPDGRTFSAQLLVPGPLVAGRELTGFSGAWQAGEGLVLSAIALPVSEGPGPGF